MALILHLSDIHLGGAPENEIADDYKQEFVAVALRTSRQQILRWTLESLHNVVEGPLDAVVVSGDVTVANREDGFRELENLLASLGALRPEPSKIVVVPGNHDVTRHTASASEERYEFFTRYVRDAGYVSPLLDGIDIDANGQFIGDTALPHHLFNEEDGWIIMPLNSSDYSGSLEPLSHVPQDVWDAALAEIEASAGPEAAAEVRRLREYDAARVSPAQLQAVHALLQQVDAAATEPASLRIAVLHHHLLPVSVREEVKSFESITNLGLLRSFLRDNNIKVVLHGHKHREFLYKDHVYPDGGVEAGRAHEVLVVAGATIGTTDWDEANVCRLLRIEGARRAPRLAYAPVAGKNPGAPADQPIFTQVALWDFGSAPAAEMPQIVSGAGVDETYERLVALFATQTELTHVVCRVENPATSDHLPEAYPDIPDVAAGARQEWYDQLVKWWQKTDSKLRERLYFTHGSRIVRPGVDQIAAAAEALRRKGDTTRAVVTLLDPKLDDVGHVEHKYPAFCHVQFLVRHRDGVAHLDCIGYFRKQQMRYWWPVNLGELRHIQKLVIEELGGNNAPFREGALWTVTALAVLGATVPRVAVPTIDRVFDEDEDRLWKLAYAVSWEGMPARSDAIRQLAELVDELVPDEDFDPDGVPVALEGLAHVAAGLIRFGEYHPESPATALGDCLNRLYRVNSDYDTDTRTNVTAAVHTAWRAAAEGLVEEARGILVPLANGA